MKENDQSTHCAVDIRSSKGAYPFSSYEEALEKASLVTVRSKASPERQTVQHHFREQ